MPYKDKRKVVAAILALLMLLAACGPEAGRPRGAGFGTGADVDNHPGVPELVNPRSKVFPAEAKP